MYYSWACVHCSSSKPLPLSHSTCTLNYCCYHPVMLTCVECITDDHASHVMFALCKTCPLQLLQTTPPLPLHLYPQLLFLPAQVDCVNGLRTYCFDCEMYPSWAWLQYSKCHLRWRLCWFPRIVSYWLLRSQDSPQRLLKMPHRLLKMPRGGRWYYFLE